MFSYFFPIHEALFYSCRYFLCRALKVLEEEICMDTKNIAQNIEQMMKVKGVSIEELSIRVGLGATTLAQVIRGRLVPGSTLVMKIAEALDMESSELLSESVMLKSLRFRSRTLNNAERLKRRESIRKAGMWLADYSALEKELDDTRPYLLENIVSSSPTAAAVTARGALSVGEASPLYGLSNILENGGIKVRVADFGFPKTWGFSVGKGEGGPAIIINTGRYLTAERQLFTLAHELGHLILHHHTYEPSIESEHAGEEKEANEFAGSFLLPQKAFVDTWDACEGLSFVTKVLKVKSIFSVSYQTVLIRLNASGGATGLSELNRKFAIDYKRTYCHDLKNFYEPFSLSPSMLTPVRFSSLVKRAYEEKLVTFPRAAQMLGLSVTEMRMRVNEWSAEKKRLRSS